MSERGNADCFLGIVQAERLGCERVMFPGHHQGFETESEAFGVVLKDVLKRAGRRVWSEVC